MLAGGIVLCVPMYVYLWNAYVYICVCKPLGRVFVCQVIGTSEIYPYCKPLPVRGRRHTRNERVKERNREINKDVKIDR